MKRLALLALLGLGCRQGQWLVYVATDAPLPQLGDQLLVSVYSRDHTLIDERALTQLAAQEPYRSFGITAPRMGQRLWVRARLTRSLLTATPAQTYIDAAGWLGAPHGRAPVALVLHLRCFGVATQYPSPGRLETCDPEGQLAPAVEIPALADPTTLPRLGSGVQTKDCPKGAVPAGMRCIPGGVLLLGEQGVTAPPNEPSMTPERLLTLPPFALNEEELSVRELIALRRNNPNKLGEPQRRDAVLRPDCTYESMTQLEGLDLPLNCVSGLLAADLCACRGPNFRLPSEAEWEYAAGNGDRETAYSFGNGGEGVQALCDRDLLSQSVCDLGAITPGSGDDLCPRAVLARGHTSDRRSSSSTAADGSCPPARWPATRPSSWAVAPRIRTVTLCAGCWAIWQSGRRSAAASRTATPAGRRSLAPRPRTPRSPGASGAATGWPRSAKSGSAAASPGRRAPRMPPWASAA